MITQNHISKLVDQFIAIEQTHPLRVGIDGFCASGKTTLANAIALELQKRNRTVIQASGDDFQHPPEIRYQLGKDSPEGFYRHAIDFEAIVSELLKPLGPEGSLHYKTSTYDIRTLKPTHSDHKKAQSNDILMLDGLFIHNKELLDHLDFTLFVKASYETCVVRARSRNQEGLDNPDQVEDRYRTRYIPGFDLYISERSPEKKATIVFHNE